MSGECEGDGAAELFENAACGLLQTSAGGTIVRVNRTLATWCGRSPSELLGRRFQDLLSIGSKLFHQTHWMPLLQMQGSVAEVQLEVLHADGRPLPILVNAFARRAPDGGELSRIDIAAMIVTDRRKYERELLLARRRAEDLLGIVQDGERQARERAIFSEQLVGIVSHDLRNPLNAIILGTHVLEASSLEPQAQRTVKRIASAALRANRLIGDLLDFTQARLGEGIRVDRRAIALHELVAEAVEEAGISSPHRNIQHVSVGDGDVDADPDRLTQVVGNLLSNAIAYGAPDAPITLKTSVGESGAKITIHNMGPPIPADLQPRIFEPMRRGASSAASSSRSVGLGLYIVHEIVRAHGGAVVLHSTAAEGTTFTVTLSNGAETAHAPS